MVHHNGIKSFGEQSWKNLSAAHAPFAQIVSPNTSKIFVLHRNNQVEIFTH